MTNCFSQETAALPSCLPHLRGRGRNSPGIPNSDVSSCRRATTQMCCLMPPLCEDASQPLKHPCLTGPCKHAISHRFCFQVDQGLIVSTLFHCLSYIHLLVFLNQFQCKTHTNSVSHYMTKCQCSTFRPAWPGSPGGPMTPGSPCKNK